MAYPARLVAITALCSLAASVSHAQVVPAPTGGTAQGQPTAEEKPATTNGKSPDDWRFAFTVYGWATNLSGSATARGNSVDINASVIDLIQKSDSSLPLMVTEANKGSLACTATSSGPSWDSACCCLSQPIAGLQLSQGECPHLAADPRRRCRRRDRQAAGQQASYTAIDVLGGVRYWNLSTELNLTSRAPSTSPILAFPASIAHATLPSPTAARCSGSTPMAARAPPVYASTADRGAGRYRGLRLPAAAVLVAARRCLQLHVQFTLLTVGCRWLPGTGDERLLQQRS